MSDKFYEDQLKNFGTEAVQIKRGNIDKHLAEEYRRNMLAVVESLMSDMKGRQWIYEQLSVCRVFTSPFIPGQPDTTAFMSGLQAYGHKLLDDVMKAAPKLFDTMMQEEQARTASREVRQI